MGASGGVRETWDKLEEDHEPRAHRGNHHARQEHPPDESCAVIQSGQGSICGDPEH